MISAQKIKKGFTLIEVLVVIGILGILATVALVAINPAEAQKKARDVQRLKDMATLQSVLEQYLADNPGVAAPAGWSTGILSDTTKKGCSAAGGWMLVNLCPYLNVLPTDPSSRTASASDGTGASQPNKVLKYGFIQDSGGYKFCAYLESTSNAGKLGGDGGNYANMFEVFSSQTTGNGTACPN